VDGFSCTTNDKCSNNLICEGDLVTDVFEPNGLISQAYHLGTVNDNSSYPTATINSYLWKSGFSDWFRYHVNDNPTKFAKVEPRAKLYNLPSGSDYKLCMYYACKWKAGNYISGGSISCLKGTKDSASGYSGLKGCCSDKSGSANEEVMLSVDCSIAISDSGTAFVRVYKKSGNKSCDKYSLMYGDD
jgi:hypothetical protein